MMKMLHYWSLVRTEFTRRLNLYYIGFFVTIGLILLLGLIQGMVPKAVVVQSFDKMGINYNGRYPDSPAFKLRHFTNVPDGPQKQVDISFDFQTPIDSKAVDLFQTAPLNHGIRLEFTPPNVIALIFASDAPPGYKALVIPGGAAPGPWHHFRVTVSPEKNVHVYVDGVFVLDVVDPFITYAMTDVVLGTGFDETRQFGGEIRDGAINVTISRANGLATAPIWKFVTGLLVMYNVVFLLFLGERSIKPLPKVS